MYGPREGNEEEMEMCCINLGVVLGRVGNGHKLCVERSEGMSLR